MNYKQQLRLITNIAIAPVVFYLGYKYAIFYGKWFTLFFKETLILSVIF